MENKEEKVETTTTENVGVEAQAVPNEEIAEETAEVEKQEVEEPKEDSAKKDSSEKMFTQEEVNKMIQERLERVKRNPDSETEQLRSTVEDLQNQLAQYEKELAQSAYKIKSDFIDYVDYKVSHLTNSETDYKTALKTFMENEGKQYLDENSNVKMPRPENTANVDNETTAIDKMTKAMGL